MNKRAITLGIALSMCVNVLADYVTDRDAAMRLVWAGRHEEALAAFTKMAGDAKSDVQKSDALEQAVLCAIAVKKYDEAEELIRQIPLAPVSKTCRMRVLSANRKWQELADTFKDEDIDGWPEDVKGDAFHLRGGAYYSLKDGKNAEADLKRAAEYLYEDNSKGLALNALGDTYQLLLKNDALAIETYRRVYKTAALYKQCQAAISIAGIFRRQGKPDEALRELSTIDMAKVTVPYWRAAMLAAFGDALAGQGKKADAIARYNEALQVPDIHAGQKEAYEKEIRRLRADDK